MHSAPELRDQPGQTQPAGRCGGGAVRGEQPAVGRRVQAAGSGKRHKHPAQRSAQLMTERTLTTTMMESNEVVMFTQVQINIFSNKHR